MRFSSILAGNLNNYIYVKDFCKDKIVLDVGCGFGMGGYFLVSNGARSYTGIDIYKHAIQYAKKHFQNGKIEYLNLDAEKMTLNEKFDVIVSFDVIEHLNSLSYLEKIKELLKQDGYFFLTTPNKKHTLQQLNRIPRYHKHEFDEIEIKNILSRFFEYVEMKGLKRELKINAVIKYEIMDIVKNIFPYTLEECYLNKKTVNKIPEKIEHLKFYDLKNSSDFFICARH